MRFVDHYAFLAVENATDPNALDRYAVLDRERVNVLAALQLALSLQDVTSLWSIYSLGRFLEFRGLWAETEFLNHQILAMARSASDKRGEGKVLLNMGNVYTTQGRYDEAHDAFAIALAICSAFEDRVIEGQVLLRMGIMYSAQGRYDEAFEAYDASLVIKREFEDRIGEGSILNNLGIIYQRLRAHDEALEAYTKALAISREFKDRIREGNTLGNMGNVYQSQGRFDAAFDAHTESLEISREFKDRIGEGQSLAHLATLAEFMGDLPEAIRQARQAVAVLEMTEATMDLEKAHRLLDHLERKASWLVHRVISRLWGSMLRLSRRSAFIRFLFYPIALR